jgi:drug/metabolite transporter (DMT)-like permease
MDGKEETVRRWQADLALGIIALIWGGTFVIVQNALDSVGPMSFVAARFALASLVLIVLFARRLRRISQAEMLAGGLIGVWLAGGYTFQTIGLQYTTTAKTGFITGLSVVIVPVLSTVLLRRPPGRGAVAGIIAATVGLGFLSLDRHLRIQSGDLWVLSGAFMFALHLVTVARFSPHFDTIRLAIAQIVAVMVLAAGSAASFETPTVDLPLEAWAAIAFMGVVATALVFTVQIYVQRFTTPTHTALLFSLEPVFAALFGWWLANERLGEEELLGCGLILAGMLVAELGGDVAEETPATPGEVAEVGACAAD